MEEALRVSQILHEARRDFHWFICDLPMLLPVAIIPDASIVCEEKYWAGTTTLGKYKSPAPRPPQRPWDSSVCQYCDENEVMTNAKTWRSIPAQSCLRRYPASISRELSIPINIIVKVWVDPIQEISEGLVPRKTSSV